MKPLKKLFFTIIFAFGAGGVMAQPTLLPLPTTNDFPARTFRAEEYWGRCKSGYVLEKTQYTQPMIFAYEEPFNGQTLSIPLAFVYYSNQWLVVNFGEAYRGYGWSFAAVSPNGQHTWAFMQSFREPNPNREYQIMYSDDAGANFRLLNTIKLPSPYADIRAWNINERGKGSLTILVNQDDIENGIQRGLYVYTIEDFGAKCSKPQAKNEIPIEAEIVNDERPENLMPVLLNKG